MIFKKIFCIMILFVLTGCTSTFYYDNSTLSKKIVSAEIVEVFNDRMGNIETSLINKVDNLESLIYDLSLIKFVWTLGRPQHIEGKCIKLIYDDGYELISNNIIVVYNNQHQYISHKDIYPPAGLNELIEKNII